MENKGNKIGAANASSLQVDWKTIGTAKSVESVKEAYSLIGKAAYTEAYVSANARKEMEKATSQQKLPDLSNQGR